MTLRPLILALGLALALPAAAGTIGYAYDFSPRTGDSLLDRQLDDINVYANGSPGNFIDSVVVTYGAPRALVDDLYRVRRWAPGDIYYACALASMVRRPCGEIVDIYERDRGHGWGVIAQRLGIKPGSAEFHALKGKVGKGHGSMRGGRGGHDDHDDHDDHGGHDGGIPPKGGASNGGGRATPAATGGQGRGQSGGQQGGQQGGKGTGGGKGKN